MTAKRFKDEVLSTRRSQMSFNEFADMTAETLNALKGWPQMAAVDFHTEFDASVTTLVLPGSVVHLSAAGTYLLGVGTLPVMPMFMFNGSQDADVVNNGGNPATQKGVWIGTSPTGQAMALVAVGAYELVSTAFVAGTFNPNDPLTSDLTGVNAGLLHVGVLYTDMIVGFVSRGVTDNGYGHDAVAFWPFPVFPGV
jgi:hypothetical protein